MNWVPVILWTGAIFALSSQPHTAYFPTLEAPSYRIFQRYVQYPAHLIEYTGLGLLWIRALRRHVALWQSIVWITVGATLLTGLMDETLQTFVPTRSFTFRDLMMDVSGGILAIALSRRFLP